VWRDARQICAPTTGKSRRRTVAPRPSGLNDRPASGMGTVQKRPLEAMPGLMSAILSLGLGAVNDRGKMSTHMWTKVPW